MHGGALPRPSTGQAYGAQWRAQRAGVLLEEPTCPGYDAPCGRPTEQVDHIKALRAGGSHARSNLRGMCGRCHRRKTAREDGAWGNPRREAPARRVG